METVSGAESELFVLVKERLDDGTRLGVKPRGKRHGGVAVVKQTLVEILARVLVRSKGRATAAQLVNQYSERPEVSLKATASVVQDFR